MLHYATYCSADKYLTKAACVVFLMLPQSEELYDTILYVCKECHRPVFRYCLCACVFHCACEIKALKSLWISV